LVLGSQDIATAVALRLANAEGTNGAVVLYNLAWTVFTVPWAVAAVPLATSAFPGLTASWQAGSRDDYAGTLARTSRAMLVVICGAAAVVIAAAAPVARVVILGAPGHVDPTVLVRGIVAFAIGLPGYALVALMTRSLYAQGNARTPAAAAVGGWLVAIGLDIGLALALPRPWTVAAIGIGTAVGVTVTGVWLSVAVVRSAGASVLDGVRRAAVAAFAGAVVAAIGGWLLAHPLVQHTVVRNIGASLAVGAVSLAAYLVIAWLVDRNTVASLLRRLSPSRLRWARG
jgi:putative peptidoglycan lipid II flippase